MANLKVESGGIAELIGSLDSLTVEMVAPKMLDGAAVILEGHVKSRASWHSDTGAMTASVKPTKAKHTGDGFSVVVRPTGKDKKGLRNMEKMAYLEFGTSKQRATPVLAPAVRESTEPVEQYMQEIFNKEVKDISL